MNLIGINSTMGNSLDTSSYRYSRSYVDSTYCVNRGGNHMLYNLNSFLVADLTGMLFNDRVAFLTGHISALLNWNLDRDLSGDGDTVSHRLVNTLNLRYLFVDGNTLFNWLWHTFGLGNWSVDCVALGYSPGVAHGLGNLSGNNIATLLGYLYTNRNSSTPRYSNGAWNLDGDLTALTLSDSSAVGRSSSNTSNDGCSINGGNTQRYSRLKGTNERTVSKEELRISFGISLSISFALNNSIL